MIRAPFASRNCNGAGSAAAELVPASWHQAADGFLELVGFILRRRDRPDPRTRRRCGSSRICARSVTTEAMTRWPTLERWACAARRSLGDTSLSLIAAAARAAQIAIGRAPPSLRTAPRAVQAFAGGSAMP